jgi:hypothetical protein
VLYLFRVRCSANRSGDPIVAGKRPNFYVMNDPELQAWIEMAHRPLIEVNDAARISGPTSFILTMTFLPTASMRAYFGLSPYWTPPNL